MKSSRVEIRPGRSLSSCHHGQNRLHLGKTHLINCQLKREDSDIREQKRSTMRIPSPSRVPPGTPRPRQALQRSHKRYTLQGGHRASTFSCPTVNPPAKPLRFVPDASSQRREAPADTDVFPAQQLPRDEQSRASDTPQVPNAKRPVQKQQRWLQSPKRI